MREAHACSGVLSEARGGTEVRIVEIAALASAAQMPTADSGHLQSASRRPQVAVDLISI